MHLYNAWLPPPVAEEAKREKESFARVLAIVKEIWRPQDPESVYSTLKWLSVFELFVKAKSDVSMEDVSSLIELGLDVFYQSHDKLHAQVRWGTTLITFLNKYRNKLFLKVQWRPLYDCLIKTHFRKSLGPEGWKLRQRHFATVTSLVRHCRRFFPQGSAMEIWFEFRTPLENPWHNTSFEGCGLLRLFLPTNLENHNFFVNEWIETILLLWDDINCSFWNCHCASIVARIIKHVPRVNWELHLPVLFTKYLNMFEVPVANQSGSAASTVDVPANIKYLFPTTKSTPARSVAKSIVYLLKPSSSAQIHFEKLVNLLEQYYHPSNGGRWTSSLERFLHYLVLTFKKRVKEEQCLEKWQGRPRLEKEERARFVHALLKLIDRGQYSKNERLSNTVASAISDLSYVEPSLVLPFVASRFHMALETTTATHQLRGAITSVAYTGRSLLLTYSLGSSHLDNNAGANYCSSLLMVSLSNALLGMDANDPPKTIASMQLIGSIISSMAVLDDDNTTPLLVPGICLSEWLDEFFCRLFSLLHHLEPHRAVGEDAHSSSKSGTFLGDGPCYFYMLQILLARLSKSLRDQALKKISKFVMTNILAGATTEVGLLCCACVLAEPDAAVTQLIEPIIFSILSSLEATSPTGFGGRVVFETASCKTKHSLSPALEMALEYQLKVLSVAICYGGAALLRCRDLLKEVICHAFDVSSWKVNGAGDHVLQSLLRSLIHYYPIDQYECFSCYPGAVTLEEWISTKDYSSDQLVNCAKWHLPNADEVELANVLIELHLNLALEDLLRICQSELRSTTGDEKDHLKVTLLRISCSLEGVMSCLPDFLPSSSMVDQNFSHHDFLIAGSSGASVGNIKLREKCADVIHVACKYLLEKWSDDIILLTLLIRIMDAVGSYGSLEYNEWLHDRQLWKLESAAIVEPPINFIADSHSKGKRRPRWAIIDKTHIHGLWRSSQAAYHRYKISGARPPEHIIVLTDDLLCISLHTYESVRLSAGNSLLKIVKRWPSLISKCVLLFTEKLKNSNASEHEVLGSCAILASKTVLKRLSMDAKAFSSFLIGILSSSHHDSIKAQKAITELFIKYNVHFAGVSMGILKMPKNQLDGPDFLDLVSRIACMSFESAGSHWRYNLMANRILLLLALVARNDPLISAKILSMIAGHFLKLLRSQLPQMRILSISALNVLLKESPHRVAIKEKSHFIGEFPGSVVSFLEAVLTPIIQEEGFLSESLGCLSHLHVARNNEGLSTGDSQANFPLQSLADKTITNFYFDFSASWPRTPSWISLLSGEIFYPSFARLFKHLVQECGSSIFAGLSNALEDFIDAKEGSKQCVAAEVLAGIMHSDVSCLLGEWESWIITQLQGVILGPSVESLPEWAACIRYAVTGKGRHGTRIPLLRQRILECLVTPLPQSATNTVVSKRYTLLSAALLEVFPPRMPTDEVKLHAKLLKEVLANMKHSSAQVRESVGVTLCILCSNLKLYSANYHDKENVECAPDVDSWYLLAMEVAKKLVSSLKDDTSIGHDGVVSCGDSKDDFNFMETVFHFASSALKSSRSSFMKDAMVYLLGPLIILQVHTRSDLALLASATLKLLKGRFFSGPYLKQAVSSIILLTSDTHWRIRSITLKYLATFMYRHTFILSTVEKLQIVDAVEKLVVDNQAEVREDAATVLAGLLKGGNEDLAEAFRDRAYNHARDIFRIIMKRSLDAAPSVASVHGAVLGLSASVLSTPYDMPSWLPEHVILLARFVVEPPPVKSTVTKAVAEFKRTHADTWSFQKELFTEQQLEVLSDTSSSSSYFA